MAAQNVRELLEARLGVPITPAPRDVVTVATFLGPSTLFRQNAARVAFVVVNVGTGTLFLLPTIPGQGEPSALNGIRLEPNGGSLTVQWDEDGEMVAWEWRGFSPTGTSVLAIPLQIDLGRVPRAAG